jgi:hypothetical protein
MVRQNASEGACHVHAFRLLTQESPQAFGSDGKIPDECSKVDRECFSAPAASVTSAAINSPAADYFLSARSLMVSAKIAMQDQEAD